MSSKKKQGPTARERRLVQGVVEGKPVKRAALDAGYAPTSATSNAYVILERPRVRSFLTDALERGGLTEDTLAAPLLRALDAKVRIINTRTMGIIESEMPDHHVQLAAFDRAVAAYGCIPRRIEMPDPPKAGLVVHIHEAQPEKPNNKATETERAVEPLKVNIRLQD